MIKREVKEISIKDIKINQISSLCYVKAQSKAIIIFKDNDCWHVNMSEKIYYKILEKYTIEDLKNFKGTRRHRWNM